MAENDGGPSLELPSFGLRRRTKNATPAEDTPEVNDIASEDAHTIEPQTAAPVQPVAVPEDEEPQATEPGETAKAPKPAKTPRPARVRKQRNRSVGAALVGLLAGFALVFATNATLRACDAAKGTSSCGGPGLFLLLAILVLILVGSQRLLKLWGFQDAGTVAFLGIGLTAIIALVFLTAHLLSATMVLVIPALSLATFLIGGWLAANMAEADES